MSDDLKNRGEPDRSRISLSENTRFAIGPKGVSRAELEQTVRSVGNSADAVKRALQKPV